MKIIKFSHVYEKFKGKIPKTARLLEVFIMYGERFSKEFLSYDTKYINNRGSFSFYPIGKSGEYIVLLFLDENNNLWTTLRFETVEKYNYYRASRGEVFKVEVKK